MITCICLLYMTVRIGKTSPRLHAPLSTLQATVMVVLTWRADGWIQEEVDLSKYAGQKVTLRFEYVTDEAVNAEGFMLDDVAINAINYSSDFESDTGGWKAGGFVRIQNILPQTYRLSIIRKGSSTTVEQVEVLPGQSYSTQLEIGGDVEKVIVVISGTARFTRQPATYRYIIE